MTTELIGRELYKFLQQWEAYRDVAYQDEGGIWTIGYGHTKNVQAGDTCTIEQATQWLEEDTLTAQQCVNACVAIPLLPNQFNMLVSLCYNIGNTAFSNSTLVKKVNQNRLDDAANQFMRWVYVKGERSNGLVRRRFAEKTRFCTPYLPREEV